MSPVISISISTSMSTLHKEILVPGQVNLLPALKPFAKDFGLVGGTAIALHIGHRESIDFDLFTKKPDYDFDISALKRQVRRHAIIDTIIRDKESEFTFKTCGVQVTFYHFEYKIPYMERFGSYIKMPSLLTLAAKKVFGGEFNAKLLRIQLSYFDDVSYKEPVIYKPGFEVADEEVKRALIEYSLS